VEPTEPKLPSEADPPKTPAKALAEAWAQKASKRTSRSAGSWRFQEVTGQEPPKSPQQPTEGVRRAEAAYLTVQLHRFYVLNRRFESTRQRMILQMFSVLLFALLVTYFLSVRHRGASNPTLLTMVIVAGGFGGFTSCLQRVYTLNRGGDPISATQALLASRASMLASSILGMIFAIALHLCFMGGLLKGDSFPDLHLYGMPTQTTFSTFFWAVVEAPPSSFAKVLVWAFIAGFAERFVPDLLDSFVAKRR
jgi:hypothetical protein